MTDTKIALTFLNHAECAPAIALLSGCDDAMLDNQEACVLFLREHNLFFAATELEHMDANEYADFICNNVDEQEEPDATQVKPGMKGTQDEVYRSTIHAAIEHSKDRAKREGKTVIVWSNGVRIFARTKEEGTPDGARYIGESGADGIWFIKGN